jgi:hypothetical protein
VADGLFHTAILNPRRGLVPALVQEFLKRYSIVVLAATYGFGSSIWFIFS